MISGEAVLIIIISLINLALWVVFFFRLKRTFSPQALLTDIKNEVDKLLIEINKTALEDVTLIEEHAKALRSLIDDADKRILLLQGQEKGKKREKEVLERLSNKKTVPVSDKKALQTYKKMSEKVEDEGHADGVQLSIDFDSYKIDDSLQPTPPPDLPEISHVENSPIEDIPLKERVLRLAANDFSPDYIANKLGCSVSEVQLIIDFYYSR